MSGLLSKISKLLGKKEDEGDEGDEVDHVEIASEAYIYFYPVLHNLSMLYFGAIWPHSPYYIPLNTFVHSTELIDWTNPDKTDPSVDVLYSTAWLDLQKPIVLKIEEIPKKRYYVLLLADCFSIPIKVISLGTRGGSLAAEQYVVVGPEFTGRLPENFDNDHIIRSLSRFNYVLGRTQLFNQDDLPDATAVQNCFSITALQGNRSATTVVPIIPYVDQTGLSTPNPEPQVYFSFANMILKYMKIEDADADLFTKFAKIEVGPSKEFRGQDMSNKKYQDIQSGIANGSGKIGETVANTSDVVIRGWVDRYYPELVPGIDHLTRAVFTKVSAFPNLPRSETYHISGYQDIDGDMLDSTKHNYTLTFQPGKFPKLMDDYGGFWSITVYLGGGSDLGALVHNPIDRYMVNNVSSPLVYDDNGALTLYFQNKSPDTDEKIANWLPTPDPEFGGYESGEFHVEMRFYLIEDAKAPFYPEGFVKASS